jgi:hypothetical protein
MTLLELEKMGCLFTRGSSVKSADKDKQGTVRILYLADVGEFSVRYRTERFLTRQRAEALKSVFLKPGDILIARYPHPLGRACLFNVPTGDFITIDDVLIFRNILKNVDPAYLCYYLNSPVIRKEINVFSRGSFRDRISKEQIGNIQFNLPAIEAQRTIASQITAIFGECDIAMTEIKKTNSMIACYFESILRLAVQGLLVTQHELPLSKHAVTSFNFYAPFERPRTWKVVRLNELLVSLLHPCVVQPRHVTSKVQMLGIDYIRENAFNFSLIETNKATRNPASHLERGDLLFYCSNHKINLKRCIVFKGEPLLVHCQHDLIRLRFDQTSIEPHFMAMMINAIFDSQWFQKSGQSIARITVRKLSAVPIHLPPYEEQIRIAAKLRATIGIVKTHVDALLVQEKNLHSLKEKILNQFFKGDSL